jgi:hypothetical protein
VGIVWNPNRCTIISLGPLTPVGVAALTTSTTVFETLDAKFESPLYDALIWCEPTESVLVTSVAPTPLPTDETATGLWLTPSTVNVKKPPG